VGPHAPRYVAGGDFEQPYIVMEHVAGRLLNSRLATTPLPARDIATIGAQIAFALHDFKRSMSFISSRQRSRHRARTGVVRSWRCAQRSFSRLA
jgi:hypothetical protein